MLTKTGRLALAAAAVCIGLGGGRAGAGGIVLQTPAGLSAGDQFRFVFITDGTTTAESSNISDYDNFVQTQAGGASYNGAVVNWLAIGSTASVNAIDHIGQTNTPVYLADGTEVTTSTTTSGLWSGGLKSPIDEDLAGVKQSASFPWTGTLVNGGGAFLQTLGTANPIVGNSLAPSGDWVQQSETSSNAELETMYGISQVLVVQASVPEPSTLLMAATAVSAGCAFGWSRRRRDQRRQRMVEEQPGTPE
jgi:PEP-CTERM motif